MSLSKNALKKSLKLHNLYKELIANGRTYAEQADAFFEEFKKRKEKPYKALRYVGNPVDVKNANQDALRGCTTIGLRTPFERAVEEAQSEYRIAYANPDDIDLDDFKKFANSYKKIFASLHMSAGSEACAKFIRLFKQELKEKIESLYDGFSTIVRKLNNVNLEKAANELVSKVSREEAQKELSKFAQPPGVSGASGGRRITRKRKGKKGRTRRN